MKTIEEQLIKLGSHVRFYRKAKGYTQEELSQLSGLHRSYIGQVERGEKNLCVKNIFLLSNCLSIEPAKLFEEDVDEFEKNYFQIL